MKKVNELVIDEKAVMREIRNYFLDAMDDAAQRLLDELAEEIIRNGAGKMRWRTEAAAALHKEEERTVDHYLAISVGYNDENFEKHQQARLRVALFGNQEQGPLRTKPGEMVYGNDITAESYHESTARKEWDLPEEWNVEVDAEKLMENAIKKTQKFFNDVLDSAWADLPDDIFYGNLQVTGG